MLDEATILKMYEEAKLTPMLVVVGGSYTFNCDTESSDYDYFGYHVGEPDQIHVGDMNGEYITSRSFDKVMDYLTGDTDSLAVFTMTNWLWATVLYESEVATSYRPTVTEYLTASKARFVDIIMKTAFRTAALCLKPDGDFDKVLSTKFNNAIHLALVAHHLEQTDILWCDYENLKLTYDINPETITKFSNILGGT